MAKKRVDKASRATGRFVPCPGNFTRTPMHGLPVFTELLRCASGTRLHVICGLCGHRGFWAAEALDAAYSAEEARRTTKVMVVDGSGRAL